MLLLRDGEAAAKVLGDWPVALAAIGFVFGGSGRRADAIDLRKRLDALAGQKYVTEYGVPRQLEAGRYANPVV